MKSRFGSGIRYTITGLIFLLTMVSCSSKLYSSDNLNKRVEHEETLNNFHSRGTIPLPYTSDYKEYLQKKYSMKY